MNLVLKTIYLTKRQDDYIGRLAKKRKWSRDKAFNYLLKLGMGI